MDDKSDYIRQPIVSVLGHVDHGKTTFLDYIRGSSVAAREAGAITQHIGATEVPIDAIYNICGSLLESKKFILPGLLFIDTPGHHAFTTLRVRGSSLADLAVLIIDINEGFKPQTYESIHILKQYRTPFVIAANKIDTISGWERDSSTLVKKRIENQRAKVREYFEERIYEIIGIVSEQKLNADLYYNIKDFRKTIAIIPISGKTGEGIPELLMVLVGLAQRFLEDKLRIEKGPAKGTVLEVKEETGLGTTIDVIIYNGIIRSADSIVVGTNEEPIVTKIKALLKPKPLDEIRDPRDRFDTVEEAHAACGIKISCQNLEGVVPGAPLRVLANNIEEIIKEIKEQTKINIELDEEGITVKADTIGSLEAIVKEAREKGIKIRKAEVGNVSKRDIIETDAELNPLNKVIFAFNVKILPEAKDELGNADVTIFNEEVIYVIMEKYDEWIEKKKEEIERTKRKEYTYPGMIKFLPQYVFRVSHPAIIGVRVLGGRIRSGVRLMKEDGKIVGEIKSIQSENKTIEEAIQGQEVAISIEGAVVGRQVKGDDILYVEIPPNDAKKLRELDLTIDEKNILEKVFEIKRKTDKFWGV